jgi:hypothetical protein
LLDHRPVVAIPKLEPREFANRAAHAKDTVQEAFSAHVSFTAQKRCRRQMPILL